MDNITPFTPDEEKFFEEIASGYSCKIVPWYNTIDGLPTILIDLQKSVCGQKYGMKRIAINYYHHENEYPVNLPMRYFYTKICKDMSGALEIGAGVH